MREDNYYCVFVVCVLLVFSFSSVSSRLVSYDGDDYVEINISEGWNLVAGSMFEKEDFYYKSDVSRFGIWSSYYWDAKNQERVELRSFTNVSEEMISEPSFFAGAFWVFSGVPGKIIYDASPAFVDKKNHGGYYQFYQGDNVIPITEEIYGKSVEEIKGDCDVLKVSYWDHENQTWVNLTLSESLDFESQELLVGHGINVKVEEDCRFFDEVVEPVCGDGVCNAEETCEICEVDCGGCFANMKNMELYSDDTVFLVSSSNWKQVLPLVSLATWTGSEDCNNGDTSEDDVCVYPTLIFHGEAGEICDNGVDDNDDGLVDCCDPYCAEFVACQENCSDGVDNDCDGDTDCADYDCRWDDFCIEDNCSDGVDNDGDGDTDCDDWDCYWDDACIENNCSDGVDNDGDGDTDCDDWDCRWDDACIENNCSDGVDNDGDGDTDCADSDCKYDRECLDNIYFYDLRTNQEGVVSDAIDKQVFPGIYDDSVVWLDGRDFNREVYSYNFETETEVKLSDDSNNWYPFIEKNLVIWSEEFYNGAQLLMHDLSNGEVKNLSKKEENYYSLARIDGRKVLIGEIYYSSPVKTTFFLYDVESEEIKELFTFDDAYGIGSFGIDKELGFFRSADDFSRFDFYNLTNEEKVFSIDNVGQNAFESGKFVYQNVTSDYDLIQVYDVSSGDVSEIARLDKYGLGSLNSDGVDVVYSTSPSSGKSVLHSYNIETGETSDFLDENYLIDHIDVHNKTVVWSGQNFSSYSSLSGLDSFDMDSLSDLSEPTFKPTLEPINGNNLVRVSSAGDDLRALLSYDVASTGPDYLDLVLSTSEIDEISSRNYDLTLLPVNDYDLFDLGLAGSYHSYDSMVSELTLLNSTYSDIMSLEEIGTSVEGRKIYAVKISDNVGTDESGQEQSILSVGNHHAREIMTVEIPMFQIKYILEHANDEGISEMINNWEMWFIPMVNPDGHVKVENGDTLWRKNVRDNGDGSYGVDLNRNYGYEFAYDDGGSSPSSHSSTYRGPFAFSEPETQAVRDFVESQNLDYIFDYHSYGEYVLYPWGYENLDTEDQATYESLVEGMQEFVLSYTSGQPGDVLYDANGISIDWYYGEQTTKDKVLGFSFEVNSYEEGGFRPPVSMIKPTSEKYLLLLADFMGYSVELNYPNEDQNSFDADSIIYFMQKYGAENVFISGESPQELDDLLVLDGSLGAGVDSDNIERVQVDQYLSFWESFDSVVYVDDDYALALMASTYASLINAPLVIKGDVNDGVGTFSGRKVICVGNDLSPAGSSCSSTHTLESLQEAYVNLTGTKKTVIINSNDWRDYAIYSLLQPDRSSGGVMRLYEKMSLSSPLIASAKHQVIIDTASRSDTDAKIEEDMQRLYSISDEFAAGDDFLEDYFLTVVANGDAVPYREGGYYNSVALDQYSYANFESPNDGGPPNMSIGRIFGQTLSDASSLMARSIFYDSLVETDSAAFMVTSTFGWTAPDDIPNVVRDWSDSFSEVRDDVNYTKYNCRSCGFPAETWQNRDFISYNDHGNDNWAGIYSSEIPLLNNSFVLNYACSTCASQEADSFCGSAIRQGAIVHIGGVNIAYALNTAFRDTINNVYHSGMSVGEGFNKAYNNSLISGEVDYFGESFNVDEGNFKMVTLIGDPTLEFGPKINSSVEGFW